MSRLEGEKNVNILLEATGRQRITKEEQNELYLNLHKSIKEELNG